MNRHRLYLYFCLIVSIAGMMPYALAQNFPNLQFSHLSTQNGLSTNRITCAIQDFRGVMWFTSGDGLNRYDGNSITVFRHNPADSSSICDNDLRFVVQDAENQLWICTAKGLCRFNPVTCKASNYYHKKNDPNSLANDYENVPFIDNQKRLWLATHAGVQVFDYKKNIFRTYNMPPVPKEEWKAHYNIFRLIRQDAEGRLWALSFYGLYLIDEGAGKLEPYYTGKYIANISFLQTSYGHKLTGQWYGGINKFEPETNSYTALAGTNNPVVAYMEEWKDNKGNNWIFSAQDDRLVLFEPISYKYRSYTHAETDSRTLNSYNIVHIFKDNANRLWFSGDNGVDILDPELQFFTTYPLYQQNDPVNIKATGLPRCVIETGNHYYAGFWYMKGLKVYDKNWKLLQEIKRLPASSSSSFSGCINYAYNDEEGNNWYGTDSGLVKQNGNRYKVFVPPGARSMVRGDFVMRNMIKRSDGLYWVRAPNAGILLFDPKSEKFSTFYKTGERGLGTDLLCLYLDKKNRLWTATNSGLYYFDSTSGNFKKLNMNADVETDENSRIIWDLLEDNEGAMWAASRNGLMSVNTSTLRYKIYNLANGLPNSKLQRLLLDSAQNLWISCDKGIIKFDRKNKFWLFTAEDGLPFQVQDVAGLFSFNKQGHIQLGTNGNVTEFNPYKVKTSSAKWPVIFLWAAADGEKLPIEKKGASDEVVLQPGQNNINIHFSILNYSNPQSSKYFYKLEGMHKTWQQSENGNIYFTNLEPGTYFVQVKTNNNDADENADAILKIIVKPHFYQTLLFKVILALAAATLIFYLVRRRIQNIRREASYKQKIAETEMQALRAQMNPHFIFNSLNSIENFIMQNEKRLASDYLNKFSRLVRSILESSKNEMVPFEKDMEALKLYVELEQLRFNNKFSYDVFTDPELMNSDYKVPSLVIQPYVENAIVHGIAHSEKAGLRLSVTVKISGSSLLYTIEDNGVGRRQSALYNQVNKPQHKSMGLQITEERIALFNHNSETPVRFTDLYQNEKATGTRVEIKVKII
ncbi:MAG: histidine kinase [Ferruginibacter sp.]